MDYELTDSSLNNLGYQPEELTDSSSDSSGYRPEELTDSSPDNLGYQPKNARHCDGCHPGNMGYQPEKDTEGSGKDAPGIREMIPGGQLKRSWHREEG